MIYGVSLTDDEKKNVLRKLSKFFLSGDLKWIDDYAVAVECLDNWLYRKNKEVFNHCCNIIKHTRPQAVSELLNEIAVDRYIACYRGTSQEYLYGNYYTLDKTVAEGHAIMYKRKSPCVITVKVPVDDVLTVGEWNIKEIIIQDQSRIRLLDMCTKNVCW